MYPPVADLLFFLRFFELECDVGLPILGVDREPICGTPGLPRANFTGTDGEGPACRTTSRASTFGGLWRLSGSFLKQVLEELARSLIHIIASSAGYG